MISSLLGIHVHRSLSMRYHAMHHIDHANMVISAGPFSSLEGYSRAAGIWTDVSRRRESTINDIWSTSRLSSVIGNSCVLWYVLSKRNVKCNMT